MLENDVNKEAKEDVTPRPAPKGENRDLRHTFYEQWCELLRKRGSIRPAAAIWSN
jgi:hypothetical protein